MNQTGTYFEPGPLGHGRWRQKPHVVCAECRRRHLVCDGIQPCTTCITRGIAAICRVQSRNSEKGQTQEGASADEINAAHFHMSTILLSWKQDGEGSVAGTLYQYITQLVGDAMRSRRGKDILLSFRDEQARTIMIWIQKCINDPEPPRSIRDHTGDYCHSLRRLLIKLCKSAGTLPPSLFLSGIKCLNRDSVAGGGFADIFEASYNEALVALKRLRVFQTDEDREKSRKAFCTEALVWQHLQHKHILPFLGVDLVTFAPFHCMVSPWMEHGNIMQCINRLHEKQVYIPLSRWLRQIAEGLKYLHFQKVVHGDLRGANILINSDFAVQLCDFGLAMFADSSTASWGSVAGGAVRWLAPEVLKGSRSTVKSDAYAFGCVCLEIHTRKPPFAEIASDTQVVAQVLQGARPEKPDTCGRLQQGLWNIVKMCWNEDPSDRPDAAFIYTTLSNGGDGLFISDYDMIFTPHPHGHALPPGEDEELSVHYDALGSFAPSSFKPTSVLRSGLGSPFTDFDVSPSSSSFGVVSLPTSSINPSPEDPAPMRKKPSRKIIPHSPLGYPLSMSSSPFTMVSSSAGSSPMAIVASKPTSVGPDTF